jgi:hypothetical protein
MILYLAKPADAQGGGFDGRWFLVAGDAFDPASVRARVLALHGGSGR